LFEVLMMKKIVFGKVPGLTDACFPVAVGGKKHQIACGIKEGFVGGQVFMPNDLVRLGSH
jgi:hypothetical protein